MKCKPGDLCLVSAPNYVDELLEPGITGRIVRVVSPTGELRDEGACWMLEELLHTTARVPLKFNTSGNTYKKGETISIDRLAESVLIPLPGLTQSEKEDVFLG